jgi:cystathionine beta-lyase
MAPSKTFNIAGLHASFAVIQNQELREKFQKARRGLAGEINLMGWVAMLAAFQEGQEWLDQLLVYLEANRDYLAGEIQKRFPGLRMLLPEATYLAWLDCRDLQLAEGPYRFFLEKAQVALNNGSDFGQAGQGFVRLNFGCPRSMLVEALDRMSKALGEREQ